MLHSRTNHLCLSHASCHELLSVILLLLRTLKCCRNLFTSFYTCTCRGACPRGCLLGTWRWRAASAGPPLLRGGPAAKGQGVSAAADSPVLKRCLVGARTGVGVAFTSGSAVVIACSPGLMGARGRRIICVTSPSVVKANWPGHRAWGIGVSSVWGRNRGCERRLPWALGLGAAHGDDALRLLLWRVCKGYGAGFGQIAAFALGPQCIGAPPDSTRLAGVSRSFTPLFCDLALLAMCAAHVWSCNRYLTPHRFCLQIQWEC